MKIPMTHHLTKPIRAINFMVLALLMTLSSPVAARDFTVAELKPLAEEGSELAQAELGNMYAAGRGVPQDYKEAMKWWLLAAEQGYVVAQTNLGIMYNKGQGVPQDYKEAMKWWLLAAEQGYAVAQTNLGIMYNKGQGVIQDYKEAIKWYRLAAEQGVADAQSNLGVMFEYGHGVLQDNTMAHMWYNIASANGNEKAGGYRDGRAGLMTNADISKAQAMARECMSSGYTKCGY
jgi:TPR repeat protein